MVLLTFSKRSDELSLRYRYELEFGCIVVVRVDLEIPIWTRFLSEMRNEIDDCSNGNKLPIITPPVLLESHDLNLIQTKLPY